MNYGDDKYINVNEVVNNFLEKTKDVLDKDWYYTHELWDGWWIIAVKDIDGNSFEPYNNISFNDIVNSNNICYMKKKDLTSTLIPIVKSIFNVHSGNNYKESNNFFLGESKVHVRPEMKYFESRPFFKNVTICLQDMFAELSYDNFTGILPVYSNTGEYIGDMDYSKWKILDSTSASNIQIPSIKKTEI